MGNHRALVLVGLLAGCGGPDLPTGGDMAGVSDEGVPDLPVDLSGEGGVGPDITVPRCKGTADDCGLTGQCVNCKTSSLGHQCVNLQCGCADSADCDPGLACVNGKCAAQGCDANNPCKAGCCDQGKCVAGTETARCGSDGKACTSCSGGTPTCANGTCTTACVLGKQGEPGVCGNGYCCGAGNQCQMVGDKSCGLAGAICADCSQDPAGPKCSMGGACGCTSNADCQNGQSCKGGICGAGCDVNSPCKSGCCSNGFCAPGNAPTACAVGGALCVSCLANAKGAACVALNNTVFCGCTSQTDCPANRACDPITKTCTDKCDQDNPCNGGCCANGQCAMGVAVNACGNNGGACTSCMNNANGFACIPGMTGGQCGCNNKNECPQTAQGCDGNAKACINNCSMNQPCAVGCCTNPAGGVCVNGTAADNCGASGICVNCTMNSTGRACRANRKCGCDKAADCPAGQSCDPVTDLCTSKCGVNQRCNGGCCAGGMCAGGKDGAACGSGGAACLDCTMNNLGHACTGTGCGCAGPADCGAFEACDTVKKQCTSTCNANQPCNGGCCLAGTCVEGFANAACGLTGTACTVCQDTTPTCKTGQCINQCGGPNDGKCSNGNCCSAQKCVPGNTKTTCGFTGACVDCTGSTQGGKCILNPGGLWQCGCDGKSDCLLANTPLNIAGQTCDLDGKTCTSTCGAPGLTACNGGCCSGPVGQCRGGGQDAVCGTGGGFCNSCSTTCAPGPKCNPNNGTCGCTKLADCFFDSRCGTGGAQRESCSVPRGSCCVPSWFSGPNWDDNGDPANCCTGMSDADGMCTCIPTGQASTGDASKCCSQHETAGTCTCLANGEKCLVESDADGECCSGLCVDTGGRNYRCSPAKAGQICQANEGCAPPLKCVNGKCG